MSAGFNADPRDPGGRRWDKRRAYRIALPGAEAVCCAGCVGGHYELLDMSLGGVRVMEGSMLPLGARVELLLVLGRGRKVAIRAVGKVVHHGRGRSLGISFDGLDPVDEERIEDIVGDELMRAASLPPYHLS